MKTRSRDFLLLFFVLTLAVKSLAQVKDTSYKNNGFGFSIQMYPAGIIPAINFEHYYSQKNSFLFRLGANFADRKDFSPYNENEKGKGFGGSFGYRRHFFLKRGKIVAGFHSDVWNMWINWKNDIGHINYTNGQSYTLVLQPWLELGYFFLPKSSQLQFGLTTGFGREINVITNGKGVGQGWMNSLLFHFQYSLKRN
jgi:hypothetical protein